MFLNFLIIRFSWVSFALSAILCANASSPAAEPGAQLECGMHPTSGHSSLHTPQATYCITFAPLQLWYFAAIINMSCPSCFWNTTVVPTKRQLLRNPAQDFKGRSCIETFYNLELQMVNPKIIRDIPCSPSLHLFLSPKYQVGTAFAGDSMNDAPSQTDGKHLPADSARDHTGWRGHCKSSCPAQPSHRQRSSTSRGDHCAFFQAEHPQGCGV